MKTVLIRKPNIGVDLYCKTRGSTYGYLNISVYSTYAFTHINIPYIYIYIHIYLYIHRHSIKRGYSYLFPDIEFGKYRSV